MKIRPFSWGWIGRKGSSESGEITFFQNAKDKEYIGSYNEQATDNRIYGFMNFLLPDSIDKTLSKGAKIYLDHSQDSLIKLDYTMKNSNNSVFSLGYSKYYFNSQDVKDNYSTAFSTYYGKLSNHISDRINNFTSSQLITLKEERESTASSGTNLTNLINISLLKESKKTYGSILSDKSTKYHNVLSLVIYAHPNNGDGSCVFNPLGCYLYVEELNPAPPYLAKPADKVVFPAEGILGSDHNPEILILKDESIKKIKIELGGKTFKKSVSGHEYKTKLEYDSLSDGYLKVSNDDNVGDFTSWLYDVNTPPVLSSVTLNSTSVNEGVQVEATLTYSDDTTSIYINGIERTPLRSKISFTPNNGSNYFYVQDKYGDVSATIQKDISVKTLTAPSLSIEPTSISGRPGKEFSIRITSSNGSYSNATYSSTTGTWKGGSSDRIIIPEQSQTFYYRVEYSSPKSSSVQKTVTATPILPPEISNFKTTAITNYGSLNEAIKTTSLSYSISGTGALYQLICVYGDTKDNLKNSIELVETEAVENASLDLSKIELGKFFKILAKAKNKEYNYNEFEAIEDGTTYFIPEGPSKPKIVAGNIKVDELPSNIPGTELEDENTINITTGNYTFYIKVTPEDISPTQLDIETIKIDFNNDIDDLVDLGIDVTKEFELQQGTDTQFYTIHVTDSAGRVNNEGFVEVYRIGPPSVVPRDIPITISDETGTDSGIDQLNYYTQLKPSTDNGVLVFNLDESENLIVNIGYTWKVNYSYNEINYPLVINKTDEDYGTIGKGVNYKTSLKDFYELIESEFGIREEKLSGEIRATIVDAFGQEATGYYSQSLNIIYAIPPKFPDKIIYIGVDPFPGQTLGERKLFFNEIFYKSSDVVPKSDDAAYLSWITKTLLNPDQKVILGIPRAEYENEASLKEYKISYALESTADNALTRRYIYKIENSFTPEKIIQNFENFEIENENLADYDFITFDLPGNFEKSNFYYFKIDAVSTQDAQTGVGDYPSLYSVHPVLQSRNVSPEIKLTNFSSDIVENDERKYLIVNSNFNFVDIGGNNIGGSGVDSYNYYPNFDKEYVNYNFTPDLTMTIEGSTAPFSSDSVNIILSKTFNFTLDSYYKMINSFNIKEEIDFNAGVELTFEKLYLRFVLTMNTGMDPRIVGEKISVQSLPAVKIHYELMPTLAYRENHLGINTKTFEDTDLFNINANQRNDAQRKYVRFRGDIGEETREIRFDLSLGQIVQVIIDGGTWD